MNRVNYARVSGVLVDICKAHGVWFDRDELRKVAEFIQSGGLDRARVQRNEELDSEARRLRIAAIPTGGSMGGSGDVPGWLMPSSGFSTGAILVDLALGMLDLFDT